MDPKGSGRDLGDKMMSEREELIKKCQYHWEEWVKAVS